MNLSSQIIFLVGPTAVGKSEVALSLAKKMDGEIVSCDSMQVYREINIASSKPSAQDLKSIRHHLIDVVSVTEEFDVSVFNKLALKAIEDILKRKKFPLVVGGSGMYMQVLLDGIFEGAPKNAELREELTREAKKKGNEFLYDKLKKLDPDAAAAIHPNNLPRLIRALEVCMSEGKKFSTVKTSRQGIWDKYDIKLFCLNRPRVQLYERINARTEEMFEAGLIDEIKSLAVLPLSQTAERIIGVKEVRGFLSGKMTLDKAKEEMKTNTRHYAKRQLTWFRKEKRLETIDVTRNHSDVVKEILERVK